MLCYVSGDSAAAECYVMLCYVSGTVTGVATMSSVKLEACLQNFTTKYYVISVHNLLPALQGEWHGHVVTIGSN
jgi:hypothetical protein